MFRKTIIALLLLYIPSTFASITQTIITCVTVKNNKAFIPFAAGFFTTDFFGSSRYSQWVTSGNACVSHTYSNGPKTVSFNLLPKVRNIRVIADDSCPQLTYHDGPYSPDNIRTSGTSLNWHFIVSQDMEADTLVYNVHCEFNQSS